MNKHKIVYTVLLTTIMLTATIFAGLMLTHGSVNRGVLSITFDDGTRNQYTTAFPLMQARNIVGTFYIPTNVTNPLYSSQMNKISVSELLQMQSAGNEIG